MSNVLYLFNEQVAVSLRKGYQSNALNQRHTNGTPIDKKIIAFISNDIALMALPNNWTLKSTPYEIMVNIDKMVNQIKSGVLIDSLLHKLAGENMKRSYMQDFVSALFLVKCKYDKLLPETDITFISLRDKLQKHIGDPCYYSNMNKAVFGKPTEFAVKYMLNKIDTTDAQAKQNAKDIEDVRKMAQDAQATAQQANKLAKDTAKTVLNGLNSKVEGYDTLEKDLAQPEPKKEGFESLPIDVQSIILNGAIQVGIVKQDNEKLVWLLDGFNLGYFALKLSEIFTEVQQKTIYNIMYHYHNGELKKFSNPYSQYGKELDRQPDEKIVELLSVYSNFKK